MNKNCGTCIHCFTMEKSLECRENSPQAVVASFRNTKDDVSTGSTGRIITIWPRVRAEDFCSKYKHSAIDG
jgi:hypothetical protein